MENLATPDNSEVTVNMHAQLHNTGRIWTGTSSSWEEPGSWMPRLTRRLWHQLSFITNGNWSSSSSLGALTFAATCWPLAGWMYCTATNMQQRGQGLQRNGGRGVAGHLQGPAGKRGLLWTRGHCHAVGFHSGWGLPSQAPTAVASGGRSSAIGKASVQRYR
jgi:hypothetical protein